MLQVFLCRACFVLPRDEPVMILLTPLASEGSSEHTNNNYPLLMLVAKAGKSASGT